MRCPFCIGGRLFVSEVSRRPKYTEYTCFSCGWVEYTPEAASKRRMRLEAHRARQQRNAPKPKPSPKQQTAIIARLCRGA